MYFCKSAPGLSELLFQEPSPSLCLNCLNYVFLKFKVYSWPCPVFSLMVTMKPKNFLLCHVFNWISAAGKTSTFSNCFLFLGDEMLTELLKSFLESVHLILPFKQYCQLFKIFFKIYLLKMLYFSNLFFFFFWSRLSYLMSFI